MAADSRYPCSTAKISFLSDGRRLSLSQSAHSQNFFSVGWPPTLATPCVHSLGEPSQGAEPARAAPILVGSGHPPSSSPGALDFRILLPLSKTNFAYHFLCNSTFPGLGAPGPRFRDLGTLSPPSPEPLDSRILLPLSKKIILLIIFLYKSLFPGLSAPEPRFRDLGTLLPLALDP